MTITVKVFSQSNTSSEIVYHDNIRSSLDDTSDTHQEQSLPHTDNIVEYSELSHPNESSPITHLNKYSVGSYIAGLYDNKWYLALITDINGDEFIVKWMQQIDERKFRWPERNEVTLLNEKNVILQVPEPEWDLHSTRICYGVLTENTLKEIQLKFTHILR
jgi:hypothetical protein